MDREQPTLNNQTNHGLCVHAGKPLTFNCDEITVDSRYLEVEGTL